MEDRISVGLNFISNFTIFLRLRMNSESQFSKFQWHFRILFYYVKFTAFIWYTNIHHINSYHEPHISFLRFDIIPHSFIRFYSFITKTITLPPSKIPLKYFKFEFKFVNERWIDRHMDVDAWTDEIRWYIIERLDIFGLSLCKGQLLMWLICTIQIRNHRKKKQEELQERFGFECSRV